MGEFLQFVWAMVDATQAALIGLNAVPVLILALVIGLGQSSRSLSWLKAIFAVVPAIVIAALWPLVYGMNPIWPDLRQIEAEIQVVVQLIIAGVLIRMLWSIKMIAAHATSRKVA